MMGKKDWIEKLQENILLWQGYKPGTGAPGERIGLGQIEKAFPHGVFPRKAIHEFITLSPEHSAASDGFIAAVLSVLMKDGAACIWISARRKLFPAALKWFNVDPERIIFVDVSRERDALWVMEEALKCEGLAAVVAELNTLDLAQSRRLQLATEQTGVTGFILRKDAAKALTSLATARWKISPAPSQTEEGMPGIGFPRWEVELSKVRNGSPGSWMLEWGGDRFVEVQKPQRPVAAWDHQKRQMG